MIVDCGYYVNGVRQQGPALSLGEAQSCVSDGDGFVWIGLRDPVGAELHEVQERFGLHELAIEDAEHMHQRPKIDDYGGSFFVVLRTAHYDDEREQVEFGEIHLFLGRDYAITIRHGTGSDLARVRHRLEERPDLLKRGPVAVLWGVVDQVVDDYEPVVQGLELDIEQVEESVFRRREDPTERIYFLRREVTEFYRAVHPLLGPLETVERRDVDALDPMRDYFRDVADHVRLTNEEILAQRDQLSTVLDANIALLSHRQSDIVRAISAWAAIITVPTLIASIYGMNFTHMPELHWRIGYPLALLVMVVTAGLLYRGFKRAKWL